jgi:hypothetical protein
LLEGYLGVLKKSFSWSSIVRRLWGTKSWKPFFYGMNFGYQQSVKSMLRNFGPNCPGLQNESKPEGAPSLA